MTTSPDRAAYTIDDITGHLAQMLLERGLGDSPLFSIKETVVDGNGMLPSEVVASINYREDLLATPVLTDPVHRHADVGQQADPLGIVLGEERDRALQEARRRQEVDSRRCPVTGAGEGSDGPLHERRIPIEPQLCPVGERLFQMETDRLLVFRDPVRGHRPQPGREPFVELGSQLLRRRFVRGIADQHVTEPERVLAGQR